MSLHYTYFKYVLYSFLSIILIGIGTNHLHAQIGLVWANSDYGTESTMSSTYQEITLDIAHYNGYVYSLIGRSQALDGEFEELYIYAHPEDGAQISSQIIKYSITDTLNRQITFPSKGVTCNNGKSFTPPRKFHLEINNGFIYIAGTLVGPTGQKFPKATTGISIPASANNSPVLFIAKFSIDGILDRTLMPNPLLSYNFIYAQNSLYGDPETVAFITDLDIDGSTGNPYIVGIYREKNACDSTIQIEEPIDYTPILGGSIIKDIIIIDTVGNGNGGGLILDPGTGIIQIMRTIEPTPTAANTVNSTNMNSVDGRLKNNGTFKLLFSVGSNTSADSIQSRLPQSAAFGAGGYLFTSADLQNTNTTYGEINFWAAYNADLTAFHIKPVPILGDTTIGTVKYNSSLSGTVLATAIAVDDNFVYVGGTFSRPKNHYPLKAELQKQRTYLLYFGRPYYYNVGTNYASSYVTWSSLDDNTDILLSPAIISRNQRVEDSTGIVNDIKFAQNSFISKYENTPTARLISEQKISGTATQNFQDLHISNNQLYALIQVYKTNAFDLEHNKVYFRTNKEYNSNSRGYEYTNFFDYQYSYSDDNSYSIDNLGTTIQNGLYLLHISNSAMLPTKEAKIEKYQKLTTANQTIPYALSDNIKVDKSGNVFVAMVYSGNISIYENARTRFDADPEIIPTVTPLAAVGRSDIGVVKFNSNWTYQWAQSIGGVQSEGMPSIVPDNNGGFYLGGAFQGLTDFEPAANKVYTLSSRGIHDAFVAKYGCPQIEIKMKNTQACVGTPIELYIDYPCLGGGCNVSYTWTNMATNANYPTTSNTHVFAPTVGTNVVSVLTVDNHTGCAVRDTFSVNALPEIILNASPTDAYICEGQSVRLSVNANLTNINYAWYKGNSTTSLDTSSQYMATTPGVYRVEASYYGCKNTASVLLNQYEVKSPRIVPDTARLCGSEIELEVKGCPGCSFNWSAPIGATHTSNASTIVANTFGTYVVSAIDNNGCSYLLNKEVVTGSNLLPTIEPSNHEGEYVTALCNDEPLILEAYPQCPTCTYTWSDGTTGKFAFAFTPGDYTVTITNNYTGCTGVSNPLQILPNNLAKPTVYSGPDKICIDNASTTMAHLYVQNTCTGCNYTWYMNHNDNNYVVGIGSSLNMNIVGQYVVKVTDTNNCSDYSTPVAVDSILVNAPSIRTNNTSICINAANVNTNTARLETDYCDNCSYKWFTQNQNNVIQEIVGATNYFYETIIEGTFFVEVTYANGCVRRSETLLIGAEQFTVYIAKTTGQSKYICNGEPVLLTLSGYYELPPIWEYQWYRNGVEIPHATGYSYNTSQEGYYYVKAINDNGCVAYTSIDTVKSASAGANPSLIATPDRICEGEDAILNVSTNPCTTCTYGWRLDNNALEAQTTVPTYSTNNKRGYYVAVFDTESRCTYLSNVVQIRERFLPTPTIQALQDPYCRPLGVGVLLTTPSEVNATYLWYKDNVLVATLTQNTYVATTTSNTYAVKIQKGDCVSERSSYIPVSFKEYTPQLFSQGTPVICNNNTVTLYVTPKNDASAIPSTVNTYCTNCSYKWYRDGVEVAGIPIRNSSASISEPGVYHVVFTDGAGCQTTTNTITVYTSQALARIQTSTLKEDDVSSTVVGDSMAYVCGATTPTKLTVTACTGCIYTWSFSPTDYNTVNIINGQTAPEYTVTGQASAGYYKVQINNNGCISTDSIRLVGRPAFRDVVITEPAHNNICNGTPVILTATGGSVSRHWTLNGVPINSILAEQSSYSTSQAGNYSVISVDTFGCIDTTAAIQLIASDPAPGFALNFDAINPIPLTIPVLNLNNYLLPTSIHNGRGRYTALTTTTAFGTTQNNRFDPSIAGAGHHIITYTDTVGSCPFKVSDTLEILQMTHVDIVNRRLTVGLGSACQTTACPSYEACLQDSMQVVLTNFPFVPTTVRFYSNNGYINVPVTPTLNAVGSVWSGIINVIVPNGAKTGKLGLTDGNQNYQTDFFLVVQNPTVDVNLQGVSQPLCSDNNHAQLVAIPTSGVTGSGVFSLAYLATPNTNRPNLLSGIDAIDVTQVSNYDNNGRQDLIVKYSFNPYYTGTTITCANPIIDTMHVEVRNINISNVEYTPISITQVGENMNKLTRLIDPISARLYTHHYTGTYVNNDSIRPSTMPVNSLGLPISNTEAVTYHLQNGGCTNTVTTNIEIYPAPSLAVIDADICRQTTDTIWLGRNANGPFVRYGNGANISFDPIYAYSSNSMSVAGQYAYNEDINHMTITSSNGGLVAMSVTQGQELYALVPANITDSLTDISITYRYKRSLDYFDALSPLSPGEQVEYIIGSVTKRIHFEELLAVAINPAIIQNPVFCKVDEILQFSGTPNGGQFWVDSDSLTDNLFNANDYVTNNIMNDFQLKYVYRGRACIDSAITTISIPKPFQVQINVPTTNFCKEEGHTNIQITHNLPSNRLDSLAGTFYVGTMPSGRIFAPSLLQSGTYPVYYHAYDIDGCEAVDSAVFTVNPTPTIDMTNLADAYCFNSPAIPLSLFADNNNITNNFGNYIVSLNANGILHSGTSMTAPAGPLTYDPSLATSGRHITERDSVIYTIVNAITGCTNTMTQNIIVRELPVLDMYRDGGEPLPSSICEGDSLRIVGTPIGGVFASVSITPTSPSSLIPATGDFVPNIPDNNIISVDEQLLYTFRNNATGCRDTIQHTITVLNRATVEITGLPGTMCATDMPYTLGINQLAGPSVTSGSFTSSVSRAIQNGANLTGTFNPSFTNLTDRVVRYTVSFRYISNGCEAQKDSVIIVNPLPQLRFTPIGDTLARVSDNFLHICRSNTDNPVLATNTYNGTTTNITSYNTAQQVSIFTGDGIHFIGGQTNRFVYNSDLAMVNGMNNIDTVSFTYVDGNGCQNTISQVVIIDTIPDLSFAGLLPSKLINQGSVPAIYSYCGNDPGDFIIPNPNGGVLYFDGIPAVSNPFNFQPIDWATSTTDRHEIKYVYTAMEYRNALPCKDSLLNYVDIKPIPVLTFQTMPSYVCVGDLDTNITLRALPIGGIFKDTTPDVLGGIINDSVFNIRAAYGSRYVTYTYTDPVTTCHNTIGQMVNVYRNPIVSFESVGGCEGSIIEFTTHSTGLTNTNGSLDSITSYVWDFGDGNTASSTTITNQFEVDNTQHTYNAGGIYFPKLTITNRGVCSVTDSIRTVVSHLVTVTPNTPYEEKFDSMGGRWYQETIYPVGHQDSLWYWGHARGARLTTYQDTNKVWVTRQLQPYQSKDRGWVLSPCFDISQLERPMFGIDTWVESRAGIDGAVVEYFRPDIQEWVNLGERNKGINWYNEQNLASSPGQQEFSGEIPQGWSGDNPVKTSAFYRLDVNTRNGDVWGYAHATNQPIRFRVSFAAIDGVEVDNQKKGFAFDNVIIRDRDRLVLIEHFSNDNIPGVSTIEDSLYAFVYDSLYGKDLVLIQYPIEGINMPNDYNLNNIVAQDSRVRVFNYGTTYVEPGYLRINGSDFIPRTEYLANNYNNEREYLDRQMLKKSPFKIILPSAGGLFVPVNGTTYAMHAQVNIVTTEHIDTLPPNQQYLVYAAITEDSVKNRHGHFTKGLLRKMVLNNGVLSSNTIGTPITGLPLNAGTQLTYDFNWNYNRNDYKTTNLKLVVFVQKFNGAVLEEVLQVATSRDLTIYFGPVPIDELPAAEGSELVNVNLYPNPAQSYFNVDFNKELEGSYDWQVTDMLGRIVSSGKTEVGQRILPVQTEHYSSGMYVFTILNDNIRVQKQVIIARP